MEHHRAELKLNIRWNYKVFYWSRLNNLFVISVLINSNIVQQDGILESNFPTTTSPLHLQRYLDFIQALKVTAAFAVGLHFFFPHWKKHFIPHHLGWAWNLTYWHCIFTFFDNWKSSHIGGLMWLLGLQAAEWSRLPFRMAVLGHATYLTNRKAIVVPASLMRPAASWDDPLLHVILNFLTLFKTSSWDLCICLSCLRAALFWHVRVIFPIPSSTSTQGHYDHTKPSLLLLAHNRLQSQLWKAFSWANGNMLYQSAVHQNRGNRVNIKCKMISYCNS